jgi:hypothetical protein
MAANIDERVEFAFAHHQAERLQQMEQGYRQILEFDP